MKTEAKKIVPLATIAVLLFVISPLANASTLTVNLNPKSGAARVDSVSNTKIIFTYPSDSTVSKYLRNISSSFSLAGTFDGSAQGAHELQGTLDYWDSHISVTNMSVDVSYSAKGNATTLVVSTSTDVNATVTGVFQVVNGTVRANLGWRGFIVRGALSLPLGGHTVEVNLAGDAMEDSLGSHVAGGVWLASAFGGGSFWNRPTLNFSQLDTPLDTWTKNYNAATNTTTFSKTISGQNTYSIQADFNGQKYSLSEISDPSGVVNVQGYADASGDTLVLAPAPASASISSSVLVVAVVVALLAMAGGYLAIRARAKSKTTVTSPTTMPV